MFQQARPLTDALSSIDAGLDELIDALDESELTRLNTDQLLRFATRIEQTRSRLAVIDNAVITDCDRRGIAHAHKDRGTAGLLARVLKISTAEAHRRVTTAHATTPQTAVTGAPVPPARPHVAAAQRSGTLNTDQAAVIIRTLHGLDLHPEIPLGELDAAERTLVGHAAAFGPADLHRLGRRITDCLIPDGTLGRDQLTRDRRYLTLEQHHDGGAAIHGRLTAAAYAALYSVLTPLTRPATTEPDPDASNRPGTAASAGRDASATDQRTTGQRWHDALEALCGRLLRSGTLPDTGGTPCTVMVTVPLHDLTTRTGHGTTNTGAPISIPELLQLAAQADIVPVVVNNAGGILSYGRTRRIFTPTQTAALTARDHGCSFPTCHAPPEWCERHHITGWADGGTTDINNGTLVCTYHHRHALTDGWDCTITEHGLPAWLPPPWIDPQRRPQTNPRITDYRGDLDQHPTSRA